MTNEIQITTQLLHTIPTPKNQKPRVLVNCAQDSDNLTLATPFRSNVITH